MIDISSKVNAIMPAYIMRLDLNVQPTNIDAQKIDNSIIQTFAMALASFQINNKLKRPWLFQETFVTANTNVNVIL